MLSSIINKQMLVRRPQMIVSTEEKRLSVCKVHDIIIEKKHKTQIDIDAITRKFDISSIHHLLDG